MINWPETTKRFGYSVVPSARRPKVVCSCDDCGKLAIITIRVKARLVDEQMSWICPSCVKKNESEIISARMQRRWENEEYRETRRASTAKLLENEGFRARHKASLSKTKSASMQIIPPQKASETVRALWCDIVYRSKTTAAIRASREKLRRIKESEAYKLKVAKSFAVHRPHSSIQLLLYSILDALGITFEREGEGTRVGYYSFDCLVIANGKKLLIECHGDYWHKLARVMARDKAKFKYITSNFPEYEIIYVWEHEFQLIADLIARLLPRFGISSGRMVDSAPPSGPTEIKI